MTDSSIFIRSTSIALVALAILAISSQGCSPAEHRALSETSKPVSAQVLTVSQTDAQEIYVASGTVRSTLNATVASKVTGRVISVAAMEGDVITAGQVLVNLDSRELAAGVNIAGANLRSAVVGAKTSRTVAEMEERVGQARVIQAQSVVDQAQASLASARAKRDLAVEGPRTQEVAQAHIAVTQAQANFNFAKIELDRVSHLVQEGAIARRELDRAQNTYDLAKSQLDTAIESEKIAKVGTRSQDLKSAQEAVTQAEGAVRQAVAGLGQARASLMQAKVRRQEIVAAEAQVGQATAAVESAKVGLAYARVEAPFAGRVVSRIVDPGAFASPGSPLMMVEGGAYRLEATVPESYLRFVSVRQRVGVQIDALPGANLEGVVTELLPQGDAASHTFIAKVTLGANPQVRSGMFGRLNLVTGSVKRVLIPEKATWVRDGLHYVFAIDAEKNAKLRVVTLGQIRGDKVEVLSGLVAGEKIVVGDRTGVADGTRIEEKAR